MAKKPRKAPKQAALDQQTGQPIVVAVGEKEQIAVGTPGGAGLTKERALKVCKGIANGMSLQEIAAQVDIDIGEFLAACEADTDLGAAYDQALQLGGEFVVHDATTLLRGLLRDPNRNTNLIRVVNSLVEHYRWVAERWNKRRYAPRMELHATTKVVTFETTLDLNYPKQAIEGVYELTAVIPPPEPDADDTQPTEQYGYEGMRSPIELARYAADAGKEGQH